LKTLASCAEKADAPELARCWRQKEPAHKLINFKNIPTCRCREASFGAPTAHCNAAFLKQAGVPVDFTRLHIGIRGTPLPDAGKEQSRNRSCDRRLAR